MYKKVKQQVVLTYVRQKLKLLERVNVQKAAKEAFRLLCTPHNSLRNYDLTPLFQHAIPLTCNFQQDTTKGYYWKAEVPNDCKILICHGFDSGSYKFEKYVHAFLQLGFDVIAFDAPAHGLSAGKTINVLQYSNFILEIIRKFGPFDGILAHSFGAIATTLAAEQLPGNSLKRIVLVSPATETTRSFNDFCKILEISTMLKDELEKLMVETGGHPISWYSAARAIQTVQFDTLWIHDKYDAITPYNDMAYLQEMHLPHVRFYISEGLGHSPYNNEAMSKIIIQFLAGVKNVEMV